MLPTRFPRSPMPFNLLRFRKALLIWGRGDEGGMEKTRQHFPPSPRCFLSRACPARSLLPAFRFSLRHGQRGLQLKARFAGCLLRSRGRPQPRPLVAFPSPWFRVLPPTRKEHRNSLLFRQRASSPSNSAPISPPGSSASPSV